MIKAHSYIPIIHKERPNVFKQFMDGYFYYRKTRFLVTENRGQGHLVLKKTKLSSVTCQSALKVLSIFTGITPVIASIWALARYIHVQKASKKWSYIRENPEATQNEAPASSAPIPNRIKEIPLQKQAGIRNGKNICWLNSEFQVIAHTKSLRDLFDPSFNPLHKRADESEEHFILRKEIQRRGKLLIDAILSGNRGKPIPTITRLAELLQRADLIEPGSLFRPHQLQEVPLKIRGILTDIPNELEMISTTTYFPETAVDTIISSEAAGALRAVLQPIPDHWEPKATIKQEPNNLHILIANDGDLHKAAQATFSSTENRVIEFLGKTEDDQDFIRAVNCSTTNQASSNNMPETLTFIVGHCSDRSRKMPNKITPVIGGPSYSLYAKVRGAGHFTVLIRSDKGKFVLFDDSKVRAMSNTEISFEDNAYYYYQKN